MFDLFESLGFVKAFCEAVYDLADVSHYADPVLGLFWFGVCRSCHFFGRYEHLFEVFHDFFTESLGVVFDALPRFLCQAQKLGLDRLPIFHLAPIPLRFL